MLRFFDERIVLGGLVGPHDARAVATPRLFP
jgi:hypothetical protein